MESLHSRGFTLIELLVVFAIITVIMAVVFTSQSTFNQTLTLKNTAYDVALTFRVAETYGLGSRSIGGVAANVGYGIHLSNATPGSFILFGDTTGGPACTPGMLDCNPGDYVYESGSDSLVRTYTLGNGVTISKFCANNGSVWYCSGDSSGLTSLDISFARPNPDTFVRANGIPSVTYVSACLALSSPQGGLRYVAVAPSGEIGAIATSCP